jgi:hypothetical protein
MGARARDMETATVKRLVAAAVAAPSIHNTQPWRFRWDAVCRTLEVRADPARGLLYEDPGKRALYVSVGAALFNLRVAAEAHGWHPDIRLLPDPSDQELLAVACPSGRPHNGSYAEGDLYDAVWCRHSSRRPFEVRRPPDHVLAGLEKAAEAEGARLRLPGHDETERLRRLTAEAEWYDHTDPPRRAESRQWIHDDGKDGLRRAGLGPSDAAGRVPVRDYSSLRPGYHASPEVFEAEPLFGVLTTAHDERPDWLRAGQALERVLLRATAGGLVASLLHQALEWHDLRWQLRDPRQGMYFVQMIIRLGYGPEGPTSPRRTVEEVFEISSG